MQLVSCYEQGLLTLAMVWMLVLVLVLGVTGLVLASIVVLEVVDE